VREELYRENDRNIRINNCFYIFIIVYIMAKNFKLN
jgi:hypothetical protein